MNADTIRLKCHERLRPLATCLCLLLLGGCSLFGIRTVEEARYTIVSGDGDIELRRYTGYVSVETVVEGDFEQAGGQGFRRLFDYISGANREQQEIAMTAPVTAARPGDAGAKIDMTAPVIATENRDGWSWAFVLPARYTIDNAPLPLRDDVILVENAPARVAVLTYSGSWKQSTFDENLERLLGWIENNRLEAASPPRFAAYDPPWTLPFLRRNEIMIEVNP